MMQRREVDLRVALHDAIKAMEAIPIRKIQ